MHLVCLMAGVSSRLGPLTRDCHKACLPLQQRRMLDYQLDSFQAAGIDSLSFVLGHGAALLAGLLFVRLAQQCFRLCHNPHYRSRNLDWSAYLALTSQNGPLIYYEGDLLVPPSLLRELQQHPAEICLALDSRSRNPCVDTLVLAQQGRVSQLLFVEHGAASAARAEGAVGELICCLKLGERARQFVVAELARQSFVGAMQLYQIFGRAFACFNTAFIDASGRAWVEVDNPRDLERASALADAILES
jgi:choline kinase